MTMTLPLTPLDPNTWVPGPTQLNASGVVQLMRALGVDRYEDLLEASVDDPARYWHRVLQHCGIVWDRQPDGYLDERGGPQFPRWFPGGRLNWVRTVMSWAAHPPTAGVPALVVEAEDGTVRRLTYAQLDAQVRQFAVALQGAGVGKGDRVGLLMENGIEASVSLLALAWIGAIVVPLFSGFGADPIVARLSDADAHAVIASTAFMRRGRRTDVQGPLREAWARLPALARVIWKRTGNEALSDPRDLDWDALMAGAHGRSCEALVVGPDEPFMVIYTSGTTGRPKGIVHTHGGFPLKIAHDAVVHLDVGPGDVFCWAVDMGWIAGPLVLCSALMRGATLVAYPGAPDHPDWSRMSRLIAHHRVTHFGAAPTLIRGLASHEAIAVQGDMASVRVLITAGEGIDPEHFVWFQRHFGRGTQPVINYTGGTEVSGGLLGSVVVRPIPPAGFNSTSPGIAVDVVDGEGRSVVDTVGELVIRRPFVGMTRSFWNDDERYLETYWRALPGVWRHGDLALRRSDGNFFMRGRSDDTLKIAGKRLGPAEVEEVVVEVPGVAEAAAIGVDDAQKGQRLVVFVVPLPDSGSRADTLPDEVSRRVGERLGKPFRPAAVHVVAQLPKTRSSKIMRRVIRSAYCSLPPGDLSSLDNPSALEAIRAASERG
jgi:acetyl-CoA synthetase